MTKVGNAATKPGRRGLLFASGVFAAVFLGGAVVRRLGDARLAFEPDPRVPGFRRLAGGDFSRGDASPLAGIGSTRLRVDTPLDDEVCDWLYGEVEKGKVPVAYFTDIACPYCRVLSGYLDDRLKAGRIDFNLREYPVFGEASEQAALAGIAADNQGQGLAMHRRLLGGRRQVGNAAIRDVAGALGLDAARLLRDMQSEAAQDQLARTRGLGRVFRFPGTPALVVGRTVLVGAVSEARLDAVIDEEARNLPFRCP